MPTGDRQIIYKSCFSCLLLPSVEMQVDFRPLCSHGKILTSWYIVPVGSVDDVVVSEEVMVVARPPVWIGHHLVGGDTKRFTSAFRSFCPNKRQEQRLHLVGAGVGCGQPAEEALIRSGRVLARSPVTRHVKRVGDHQFSSMEVCTQNKRDILHPPDYGSGLRGNLHLEIWMRRSRR